VAKRRLGKGIDALLQGRDMEQVERLNSVVSVPLDDLRPNPDQPRKHFSEDRLKELADSVREKGVIQPILVEESPGGGFLIVAGERRFRAAKLAGLDTVPVILRDFTEDEKLEIALIENLQREDLNPIEEATAFRILMETAELTQDELAKRLGMNRSTIANGLRLLKLESDIQQAISDGALSAGHARAILSVEDTGTRKTLVKRIKDDGISVREAESMAAALNAGVYQAPASPASPSGASAGRSAKSASGGAPAQGTPRKSVELKEMEERLLQALGTKVVIKGSNTRGKLEIDYFSMEDLERIFEIIAGE